MFACYILLINKGKGLWETVGKGNFNLLIAFGYLY